MSEIRHTEIRSDLHPEIEHGIDPDQLARDLQFDQTDLSKSFADQAPLQHYYGERLARANSQWLKAKSDLELTEALVGKAMRAVAQAKGAKITESQIDKETPLDTRWQDAQRKLRDAKYVQDLLQSIYNAFETRRWMLQSQGKTEQAATQGQLRLVTGQN